MRVLCSRDTGDSAGKRPLEGFLRGKPQKVSHEGAETANDVQGGENTSGEQPFGFYRPAPEAEERDRIARRLWKQVFG